MKAFFCKWTSTLLFGFSILAPTAGAQTTDETKLAVWEQVGHKQLKLGALDLEVWYPSEDWQQKSLTNYDLRQWLPPSEAARLSDADVPLQSCECQDSAPVANGPFPVIFFVHGTAAFRTQSLSLMTHLAQQGFVVVAADHPGLYLKDLLLGQRGANIVADLTLILDSLRNGDGIWDFLQGQADSQRLGLIGHSAGGSGIVSFASVAGAQLLVPMAAGGSFNTPNLKATLILGGIDDRVVPFSRQVQGFAASPASKRLVGIANAGHLAFSDLCGLRNDFDEDLLEVSLRVGINNAASLARLWDGCGDEQIPPARAAALVNALVAAAARETLQGIPQEKVFQSLRQQYPELAVYDEVLSQ